jgi:CheY-like chemotaxis protein
MLMAKVLIVDANQDSRAALGQALLDAGYEVASAADGTAALGMLEWEQPDLVVSAAKFDDMDGFQLLSRVREDTAVSDAVFVLLAGHNRPIALAAAEAGADMTITGEFTLSSVVSRIGDLLAQRESEEPRPLLGGFGAGEPRSTEPLWAAVGPAEPVGSRVPGTPGFSGSLSVMDLTELVQALAIGGKSGSLVVSLAAGEAIVVLEAGRVVHAGYRGLTGEGAFAALVSAGQRESEARFRFNRAERHELDQFPRTMSRSAEQLLLSIAVGIDERTGEPSPLGSEGGPHSHRLGG